MSLAVSYNKYISDVHKSFNVKHIQMILYTYEVVLFYTLICHMKTIILLECTHILNLYFL